MVFLQREREILGRVLCVFLQEVCLESKKALLEQKILFPSPVLFLCWTCVSSKADVVARVDVLKEWRVKLVS